ncbi:hypothetical protein ColTof4_09885 [Colletotrichum tofieldiae]|nr:hypothetical protein ColTof3_05244 [Colletotrichum tofieldiae]GKT77462.1 hypothetical protein ColTof4_09885 [Colletotrichum tofieldiae]
MADAIVPAISSPRLGPRPLGPPSGAGRLDCTRDRRQHFKGWPTVDDARWVHGIGDATAVAFLADAVDRNPRASQCIPIAENAGVLWFGARSIARKRLREVVGRRIVQASGVALAQSPERTFATVLKDCVGSRIELAPRYLARRAGWVEGRCVLLGSAMSV